MTLRGDDAIGRAMRIIFMGTPDFATPALQALIENRQTVVAVYTRPPKPAGRRGLELTKSPVHLLAERLGLTVLTPKSLRSDEAFEEFSRLSADVAIVAAYGLILPPPILAAPRAGCLNLHGSLLPRWRGAAPIQRAIMAGDSETGVGLMQMEAGLDTGPVAREARVPIRAEDTAGDLTASLARLGAKLLSESLADIEAGTLNFRPQAAEGVLYARKIEKVETPIDWTQSAVRVRDHIHGLSPSPGAFSEIEIGGRAERVKFLRVEVVDGRGAPGAVLDDEFTVACGDGAVRARLAQRAGKSPMSGAEIMRGGQIVKGGRFTVAGAPPSER